MQDEPADKPKVWLNRRKASLWLQAKYGMRCSPATLAKKAVRGNGPVFAYMGSLRVYTPEDLDAWAQSRLSAKVHSTAGRAPTRRAIRSAAADARAGSRRCKDAGARRPRRLNAERKTPTRNGPALAFLR